MKDGIEKKVLELDKMLEMRTQLINTQNKLGMSNGFDDEDAIIILSIEEFLKIADHIGECIHKRKTISGHTAYYFFYKGAKLERYALEQDEKWLVDQLDRRCKG